MECIKYKMPPTLISNDNKRFEINPDIIQLSGLMQNCNDDEDHYFALELLLICVV